MLKGIINRFKREIAKNKLANNLNTIVNDPQMRLDLLQSAYEKHRASMTDRERSQVKKEIKALERAIKRGDVTV